MNNFETTHWSDVLAAGEQPSERSRDALKALCSAYWSPVYQCVHRQIHNKQEAEDLTQDFFHHLLEKNVVANADPRRGRFRSYLLTSLRNYLTNEWKRRSAEKRGGGKQLISIGSSLVMADPPVARGGSPDQVFERQWAVTLLDRSLNQLQNELAEAGKPELFDNLKPCLTNSEGAPTYAEIAAKLNMTQGAVRAAALRLRRRFRQIVRAEVSLTVGSSEDVDDEIHSLFRSFCG